jgi:hypothetical protein
VGEQFAPKLRSGWTLNCCVQRTVPDAACCPRPRIWVDQYRMLASRAGFLCGRTHAHRDDNGPGLDWLDQKPDLRRNRIGWKIAPTPVGFRLPVGFVKNWSKINESGLDRLTKEKMGCKEWSYTRTHWCKT